MSSINNPAGRLHGVLTRWNEVLEVNNGQAPGTIWAGVLDDSKSLRMTLSLARVAELLPKVEAGARLHEEETGDGAPMRTVAAYAREWAKPLFYLPVGNGQALSANAGAVSQDAMLGLENVSSVLRISRPEGRHVPEDERGALRDELDALVAQVRDDDDLDPKLKSLVLMRLHDVAAALDHYGVAGPDGLVAASERLAAATVLATYGDEEARGRLKSVVEYAGKLYIAVAFVGATGDAANAVEMGMRALGM